MATASEACQSDIMAEGAMNAIGFPITAGRAVDLLGDWYARGKAFPAEVVLTPRPYPA